MLRGHFRDPLLGRDILIGFAAGLVLMMLTFFGGNLALAVCAALAIWAFYISLAGRPVFADSLAAPD